MKENNILPEKFEDRIIFMSMFHDIDWGKAGNKETCISEFFRSCGVRKKRFPEGHWSFFGAGTEEKSGMERTHASQTVDGTMLPN